MTAMTTTTIIAADSAMTMNSEGGLLRWQKMYVQRNKFDMATI